MELVFVYGTLKRNEPNHFVLTDADNGLAKFVADAETAEKYPLVIATRYNVPFLLYRPGVGHLIKGEIYEVDENMLKALDALEEHPDFYERNLYDVRAGARAYRCWIYFLKTFKAEMLRKEMFVEYTSDGPHGLKYVERYLRDTNFDHRREVL